MRKLSNIDFRIQNSATAGETNIEIYDNIGEYNKWLDYWTVVKAGVSFESFRSQFESAVTRGDKINININSKGGDFNTGLAIYNLIQKYPDADVHSTIEVEASSAALLISQAVKKGNRKMNANATGMLHQVSVEIWASLNANEFREYADILDKFDDSLAISMADTMGMSVDDFKADYFDGKDHFFTSEEALAAGLIDEIIPTTNKKSVSGPTNFDEDFISKLATKIHSKIAAFARPNNFDTPKNIIMNLDNLKNELESLSIDASKKAEMLSVLDRFNESKFNQADIDTAVSTAVAEATEPIQAELGTTKESLAAAESALEEFQGGGTPAGAADNQLETKNQSQSRYTAPIQFWNKK